MNNKPLLQSIQRHGLLGQSERRAPWALIFVANGTEERLGLPAGSWPGVQTAEPNNLTSAGKGSLLESSAEMVG